MMLQFIHDQAEVVSGQSHQSLTGHLRGLEILHLQGDKKDTTTALLALLGSARLSPMRQPGPGLDAVQLLGLRKEGPGRMQAPLPL